MPECGQADEEKWRIMAAAQLMCDRLASPPRFAGGRLPSTISALSSLGLLPCPEQRRISKVFLPQAKRPVPISRPAPKRRLSGMIRKRKRGQHFPLFICTGFQAAVRKPCRSPKSWLKSWVPDNRFFGAGREIGTGRLACGKKTFEILRCPGHGNSPSDDKALIVLGSRPPA